MVGRQRRLNQRCPKSAHAGEGGICDTGGGTVTGLEMKLWLPLLVLGLFASGSAQAVRVFVVRYASEADVKVYRVQYPSEANLRIHWVDYRSEADGDALWWRAEHASDAELKVYYVDYPSEADLKVYEAGYRSEAGWNGSPKGLQMLGR